MVSDTLLCCVFALYFFRFVYPMLPVSLDCPFLIAPSVFSHVYLEKSNYLPDVAKSPVSLFAADHLLCRSSKTAKDHNIFQENLDNLEIWSTDSEMKAFQ